KLNLVDEAAALTKIRDILSTQLGREATANEVADAVGKKDEQRVSRLFRFHEAPDVVKEGVIGQRLVARNHDSDGALLATVKTSTKGQKTIDLHAALEFSRLHKHFAANAPAKADERATRIIDRAREGGWSLRRIQGYVKAIVSGTARLPSDRPVFSHDSQRLTLYLPRLASASAEARSDLRATLKSVLDELDRLDTSNSASGPGPTSA
ncbi:MAG TPA: hypothetical protein VKB87_02400, partial [Myxococcaceae bacterium]|nr:hypothetical protein [Myxococcaceae bacterium]